MPPWWPDAGKAPELRARKGIRIMQTELKRTALAVGIWRRNHPGRTTAMPVELQRNVVKLLEKHSWDEICGTVGISRSSLGNLRKRHGEHLQLRPRPQARRRVRRNARKPSKRRQTRSPRTSAADFVEIPVAGPAPRLHVELKLPSGIVLHAHSDNDVGAVGDFVARLLADTQSAG